MNRASLDEGDAAVDLEPVDRRERERGALLFASGPEQVYRGRVNRCDKAANIYRIARRWISSRVCTSCSSATPSVKATGFKAISPGRFLEANIGFFIKTPKKASLSGGSVRTDMRWGINHLIRSDTSDRWKNAIAGQLVLLCDEVVLAHLLKVQAIAESKLRPIR